MAHPFFDTLRGNLVEHHTLDVLIDSSDFVRQVSGDCLSFTVRVSCQEDCLGLRCAIAQLFNDCVLPLDVLIDDGKFIIDIDAKFALWEILDVTDGSLDDIFLAEILVDCLRFRRRFNYDE